MSRNPGTIIQVADRMYIMYDKQPSKDAVILHRIDENFMLTGTHKVIKNWKEFCKTAKAIGKVD